MQEYGTVASNLNRTLEHITSFTLSLHCVITIKGACKSTTENELGFVERLHLAVYNIFSRLSRALIEELLAL